MPLFARTEHGSTRRAERPFTGKFVAAIHGSRSRTARARAPGDFKSGAAMALLTREILDGTSDKANLRRVVYFEPPNVAAACVRRVDLVPNGWGRRPSNNLCIDRSTVLTPSSMHIDGYC